MPNIIHENIIENMNYSIMFISSVSLFLCFSKNGFWIRVNNLHLISKSYCIVNHRTGRNVE
jgi:hypothetical protein